MRLPVSLDPDVPISMERGKCVEYDDWNPRIRIPHERASTHFRLFRQKPCNPPSWQAEGKSWADESSRWRLQRREYNRFESTFHQ